MDLSEAKRLVCDEVDARAAMLVEISHEIHSHPELGFGEHLAHDVLTAAAAQAGMDVERGAYGMDTAFAARAGTTGPAVAVMCEYDALPGIGHACGHNVIAAAGLGAGLAAAALAERLGGRVVVFGTPAEEGGGGKVHMLRRGALEGVDAAMMVHPAEYDLTSMTTVAIQRLVVEYHGRAAHAAASPESGINALDAAVIGYTAVGALRQHIRADERVHGIFTDSGDQPNIVPAHTAMEWYVRARDLDALAALGARVLAALEAGASATGCTMTHEWLDPAYADMRTNAVLAELYGANAAVLGRDVAAPDRSAQVVGSTDMGNVSYQVPSIHPMIAIAPDGVSIHSAEFARFAAGPQGDRGVLDGAKAMAMTVVDLWMDPDRLTAVQEAFVRSAAEGSP